MSIISAKRRVESLFTRVRSLLYRASTDPMITRETVLELLDRLEGSITEIILNMTAGQKIQISLFPTFLNYEKELVGRLETVRKSVMEGNFAVARKELEALRSRFYSYLRIASVIFAGKREEEKKVYAGIKAPEGLSPNALKIFAFLLQKAGGEADLITLQHALNMSEEDLENAIDELKEQGYVETFIRGMSMVVRLKEGMIE